MWTGDQKPGGVKTFPDIIPIYTFSRITGERVGARPVVTMDTSVNLYDSFVSSANRPKSNRVI